MALYRYYDPKIGKRRPLKSVAIVNSDGTNEYTPNQIKAIEDDLIAHKVDCVHLPYSIADGTNTYTTLINGISSLAEGMSIKIKFTNANTGASTLNINGLGAKPIQKSNGNALSSGNIKAGQIVHLVYTGSVFQLLGEGGEYGTAQAQDVLEGKTIGTEEGLVTGAMPNNGAINRTITTQGGKIIVPEGYHDGRGIVKAQFANLIASNIRKGVNIGGVVGMYETPAETIIPDRDSVMYTKKERLAYSTNSREDFCLYDIYMKTDGDIAVSLALTAWKGTPGILRIYVNNNLVETHNIQKKDGVSAYEHNISSNIIGLHEFDRVSFSVISNSSSFLSIEELTYKFWIKNFNPPAFYTSNRR